MSEKLIQFRVESFGVRSSVYLKIAGDSEPRVDMGSKSQEVNLLFSDYSRGESNYAHLHLTHATAKSLHASLGQALAEQEGETDAT